jgi:hypothetical protein
MWDFTAASLKITALWYTAPCSLVEVDWRFNHQSTWGDTYGLYYRFPRPDCLSVSVMSVLLNSCYALCARCAYRPDRARLSNRMLHLDNHSTDFVVWTLCHEKLVAFNFLQPVIIWVDCTRLVDWLVWWGETAVSALRPWACCTILGW